MLTARKLREENIAEYLLYMWQAEDLVRACGCDAERTARELVPRSGAEGEDAAELREWYAGLCDMMRREGVTQSGHLQVNRNVTSELTELSARLLKSSNFPRYHAAFYKAAQQIAEVRKRGGMDGDSDIEVCFNVLYGILLLKMQKKEISAATTSAVSDISALIALLAAYYKKDRNEPLDF